MFLGFMSSDALKAPKEIFNLRVAFITGSAAMAGSMFGFDSGNIGGILTLPAFKRTFGLYADGPNAYQAASLSGNITSTLQAGAIAGALTVVPITNRFGRKWCLVAYAALYILGCCLQLVANVNYLFAGRVLAGLATGATSILAPMYISENAPKSIRGALATCYNLIIIAGLTCAFWINYAVSKYKVPQTADGIATSNGYDKQWRIPMGVQMIPGAFLFIGMCFSNESPRWLVSRDRHEEAIETMVKLRKLPADHPYLALEIHEIREQVAAEEQAVAGSSYFMLLKEIFSVPSNRRRLLMCALLQVWSQLTGTSSINYYAPSIFASIGITGTTSSLLATGIYGIVKLVTTIFYIMFLVDRIGRRRPVMVGALIQALCLLYLAIFVKVAHPSATSQTTAGGYVGVTLIFVYAFGWSFGWSVVPWVVTSEVFPTRIRSLGMSLVLGFQWLLIFTFARATPYMMINMDKWGAYLFFSLCSFIGVVWIYFFLPEFKGRSIESVDNLYSLSSTEMRKHFYPTEEEKSRHGDALGEVSDRKLSIFATTIENSADAKV